MLFFLMAYPYRGTIEKISGKLRYGQIGDEMYKDLDGDNQITAKDQVNIGTTDPKLIYGIGLNVQYKKFSLNILGKWCPMILSVVRLICK